MRSQQHEAMRTAGRTMAATTSLPMIWQKNVCIGRTVPKQLAIWLNHVDTTNMTVQEFIDELRRVNVNLEEENLIRLESTR